MATKQRADKQKEKEKKEKIILGVLVGLLVIVGALELPKMLKSGGSSDAAATTAQTTSTSPVATSASGTAAAGPVTVGSLPNPNSYVPSSGQLSEFSLFSGGDPFGSATTSGSTTSSATTTTTPKASFAAAKIAVNGSAEVVLLNGTFPSVSPAFVLDSITAKQIQISVSGGSFESGQAKVTIKKGISVALVNTADAMRYEIKYIVPFTADQAAVSIGTTSTSGTSSGTTSGTAGGTTTSSTISSTTG